MYWMSTFPFSTLLRIADSTVDCCGADESVEPEISKLHKMLPGVTFTFDSMPGTRL